MPSLQYKPNASFSIGNCWIFDLGVKQPEDSFSFESTSLGQQILNLHKCGCAWIVSEDNTGTQKYFLRP